MAWLPEKFPEFTPPPMSRTNHWFEVVVPMANLVFMALVVGSLFEVVKLFPKEKSNACGFEADEETKLKFMVKLNAVGTGAKSVVLDAAALLPPELEIWRLFDAILQDLTVAFAVEIAFH